MMGTKARLFTPVTVLSLDELVPADHFYRHLIGSSTSPLCAISPADAMSPTKAAPRSTQSCSSGSNS